MKAWAILAALLLLLIGALSAAGQLIALPAATATGGDGGFDTSRAMARLHRILGDERPHPVDSAGDDSVRMRLIAELRALGLRPRVTDGFACNGGKDSRAASCARVRNVVATIGPAAGRHVLLASHYDSTPVGPGAADDGIGVAVMLETAALLEDRPLKRPVTFLFDEGEEAGLLGARAFLEQDPLAARVDSLVNLEARGVEGPAIMFETSRPNGAAVAHFERSVRRPVANSLNADFYRLIPNDTDVSVFHGRGWTILNFAIIGNETRYHSPNDRLSSLDPRSVRHMGEQALAVTAELASGEAVRSHGTRLYADVAGRKLVSIPLAAGVALYLALLLLFAGLAWRRRRGGVGRAAAAVAAAMVGAAVLSFAGQAAVGLIRSGEFWRAHPQVMAAAIDLTALLASALALLRLARPLALDRLRIGFWLAFLALGGAIGLAAPGAIIFYLLPPLVAGAAMSVGRGERVAALLAWALLYLSWGPLLHLSETLLDLDGGWVFAPVAALLLLPALIEMKPLLNRVEAQRLAAGLAGVALAGWAFAALTPAYSTDRKQAFGIEYLWNAAERRAEWLVVNDGAALPAGFPAAPRFAKGLEVPWSTRRRWSAPAPALPLPAPSLEKLDERSVPQGRRVSLRLRTGGAETIVIRGEPGAGFRAAGIGRSVVRYGAGKAKDPYFLRCHGRSCDGVRIELLLGEGPAELTVIGIRSGLPSQAKPLLAARPANASPQYSPDASIALARVTL